MNRTHKIAAATILSFLLAACSSAPSSVDADKNSTNENLNRLQANQPIPAEAFSQYRQTAIDVEQAEIAGVATTTFFFNMGVQNPIETCPSIGFPVASTAQLTNPSQVVSGYNNGSAVVGQAEPNGVYTGSSTGTYVVCVAPSGTKFINYWEGSVHTVGGAARWDRSEGMIVLAGEPTVVAKTKK